MTSVESKEICKFPFTCYDRKCEEECFHPVPYETRSKIAYLMKRRKYPEEKKTKERKCFCRFGPLCNKPKCGYRHPLSAEGREMLQKDLKEKAEKSKKEKVDAPESFNCDEVEESKKEKKVEVDACKKALDAYHRLKEEYCIPNDNSSGQMIETFIKSMMREV